MESNTLSNLFSKTVSKPAPVYNYDITKKDKSQSESIDDMEDEDIEKMLDGKSGDLVSDGSEEKVINNRIKYEDNKERVVDLEIDERTVFVGNLPATTQKKQIKKLFAEVGRPETVRFRCAARPDMKTTKKVAVITKNFHEESSNICAYVKMKSPEEAKAACRLNGCVLGNMTVRVDLATGGRSHDNKRSVFLGNLSFNTKEENVRQVFAKCGEVENVRLVRDSSTGIGKGFGYVNFEKEESVALALRLNSVEVDGRKIRVSKAIRKHKTALSTKKMKEVKIIKKFNPEMKKNKTLKEKSFQGVNTSEGKVVKKKVSKQDLKKKAIAHKLSS